MKNILHEIRIFSALPANVLQAIEKYGNYKSFKEGSMLIWAQDECQAVYFVVSGMVEVFHLALSGKEQILDHIQPGESFNLVPVFMNKSLNQANVRAVADTRILLIRKKEFLYLMAQFPELSRSVAEYFAMRLSYMVNMVEKLALFSVRQRMAAFLINQADHQGEDVRPRWTQDDMARWLGTVRDVVGRTLRKLEADGLIRFDRQRIELLDRVALERLAQGEE